MAQALADLEAQVATTLRQPGAPAGMILRAKASLLLAIEDMPEARAIMLVEEAARRAAASQTIPPSTRRDKYPGP